MQCIPGSIALSFTAALSAQGVQWLPLPAVSGQPNLVHAAMASDPVRGRIVLFGADATTLTPSTWEWDGGAWHAMTPAVQPPVRNRGAMAFDPAGNQILFTGGVATTPPFTWLTDAWTWDGVAWQQLPADPNRRVALAHAVTTDLAGRRVLFVDQYGWLTTWNGSTWQPIGNAPSQTQYPMASTAAWDPVRGRLVFQLYGFDIQYPAPWYIPTMVYRWSLFEWDGAFHAIAPQPSSPVLNYAQPMFFDAERQRVGVLDQPDLVSPLSTREWSGSWQLAGQQPLTFEPLVAYDAVGGTTMIYDGALVPVQAARCYRLVSTTPATVESQGNGCPGSLGIPALTAAPHSRPWTGDVFRVAMDRVPTGSFPFVAAGFAPAQVGLAGLGMPGCQLLVVADLFAAMLPAAAQQATWSLHVPAAAALAGTRLHLQGGVLSAGGAGPFGGATSQRLIATVGIR